MDFALAIYVLLYNNTKGVFPIEAFRLEVYLLLSVILFSDETSFTRDSVNNLRNVHTWYQDNPHETSVTAFQRRFTVNVWYGVLRDKLIGTARSYFCGGKTRTQTSKKH